MPGFKDALLLLATYPDTTPEYVIDQSVALSALLGARLSALVSVLDRRKLARAYSHGSWLIDVPNIIDTALSKSAGDAQRLLTHFEHTAKSRGIFQDEIREGMSTFAMVDHAVGHARLRDLTFVPIPDLIGLDELQAEDVIFGTGRPVILLPAYSEATTKAVNLDTVVVAWDFSRAASRALADAMPLLRMAKSVRVFTVRGEKDIPQHQSLKDVDRHLRMHGVAAIFDDVDIGDRSIGDAMRNYLAERKADLFVMGAFGHSRLREFVLGGATRSILGKPPVPVFVSH